VEISLLHHYRNDVWHTMNVRHETPVHNINRDLVPKLAISSDYLLYAMLSISAAHKDFVDPSQETKTLCLRYRTKALGSYTKALKNITWENYETMLVTSLYMMGMVPPPENPCSDDACLKWISALLTMMQGLRLLAGLKWARGIEKLAVFPLFRRELRNLPPPPQLGTPCFYANVEKETENPLYPNPPTTYQSPDDTSTPSITTSTAPSPPPKSAGMDMSNLPFRPQELMSAGTSPHSPQSWKKPTSWQIPSPAFLPPPLMALLQTLIKPPPTHGPIDINGPILLPTLHAFSPIFLSLYYYHLNPDLYVRIVVLPTFITPEFLSLVASREPRALVMIGWWFAFVRMVPGIWWLEPSVGRVLQAVSNEVMRCNDKVLMEAMEGAHKIHRVVETWGREAGGRSVFEGWDGVNWEEGPIMEERWSFSKVVDLEQVE
jgi:hypothetical protein